MKLNFKPTAVFNRMGGQIIEITGIGHKTDWPQQGYSRDYWFYIGTVKWDDTGKTSTGHIEPAALCADSQAGHDEINEISKKMNDYLAAHGTWNETAPRGWYAHRKEKATAAERKAAERARHKEARRVAVTHYVYPEDREKVSRYIKRLVERTERARSA